MSSAESVGARNCTKSLGLTRTLPNRNFRMRPAVIAVFRFSALAILVAIINSVVPGIAAAQVAALPQPNFTLRDVNDVDLLSANVYLQSKVISIGSVAHSFSDTAYSGQDGDWLSPTPTNPSTVSGPIDSYLDGHVSNIDCSSAPHYASVSFGPSSEDFNCVGSGPSYSAAEPTGSTLTSSTHGLIYTKRNGTQIVYNVSVGGQGVVHTQVAEIIYPDGRTVTYNYSTGGNTAGYPISLTRNDGLELQYTWAQLPDEPAGFLGISSITAINNAYEYCDPTTTCSLTKTWPTATFVWGGTTGARTLTVTDYAGRATIYTMDADDRTVAIQLPSSTGGANITYAYCNSSCTQYTSTNSYAAGNYVASVTRVGVGTWSYTGNPGPATQSTCATATYGFTSPVNTGKTVTLNNCPWYNPTTAATPAGWDPFEHMIDEQGVESIGPGPLIQSVLMPEGNQTGYTWNSRGDLTNEVLDPKPGYAGSIPLSANYDASCSNPLTCNEPNSTTDGNQNTTTYTYNPSNGRIASIKRPAVNVPSVGSVVPETDYTYVQRYAWVMNSAGNGYVEESTPIWVRSTETYCRTGPMTSTGCSLGAADQVTKTFYYGPNSGPNNLFLRGVAVQWNGTTHITCYGYDMYGNRISVTKPNAGFTQLSSCDQFTAP